MQPPTDHNRTAVRAPGLVSGWATVTSVSRVVDTTTAVATAVVDDNAA
jgi:hypothetical protein